MNLEDVRKQALEDVRSAGSAAELEEIRVRYLGRKGAIADLFSGIGRLSADERRTVGRQANELKKELAQLIESSRAALTQKKTTVSYCDPTLPGKRLNLGHIHPISRTFREIEEIFARLGFQVERGPEVELEYFNFEALNIPVDHPSRDAFDTFYIKPPVLLRSHTSPVQIRVMERTQPPIRVIAPGRTFRPDTEDARHASMFNQVEGLMVEEGVTFADLKAMLHIFAREYFGEDTRTRFRPSFFPFTEPSAEVDVSCFKCKGAGCSLCSGSGWLEVLGCGMVDPAVFEAVGYDAEKYTGFAFGMGVERVCMLRHGIDDIRLFTQNDMRFLRQF